MLHFRLPLFLVLIFAASYSLPDITNRMTLIEAIETARNSGTDIIYSSLLVQEWMLVRATPEADNIVEALQVALASYDLGLEQAGENKWLVVAQASQSHGNDSITEAAVVTAKPTPQPPTLDEITIVGSRHSMYDRATSADQFLSGEDIRLMPHIADDAYRAFHRLPGVAANDFQAPFNLRGGTANEVKVQLDGFEIFEPFHMRTLYRPLSIIDAGIIGDAQILSGGFTAEHGNFMSGVVDIETQRNDGARVHEVGVSFVSAFARSSGSMAEGRGSYFLSARRGFLDLMADSVTDEGEELQPRYGDLFGRISYDVSENLDVSLQTLLSDDDVTFIDPGDGEDFGEDGSMQYLWLTAHFSFASGVSSSNTIFSGNVESNEFGGLDNSPSEVVTRDYSRDVDFFGVSSDWQFSLDPKYLFRVGARYRDLTAKYDYFLDSTRRSDFVNNGIPYVVQRDIETDVSGSDVSVYGSFRIRATDDLFLEFGLRWDDQDYGAEDYDAQIAPRFNALYQITDRAELRLAWGEFYQAHAIQDLQVEDGDLNYYEPELAEHLTLGLRYDFASGLQLQADIYDKQYRDLRPRYENLLDLYEFAPESNFDRVVVEPDSGRAYGAELTLRSRVSESFNWWASYTWSKAQDQIDGQTVLRGWDQRNAVTASLTWHGERWSFSAVGRYHSGWPRTPLVAEPITDGAGNIIGIDVDLSQRNSDTFDDYSRLDLRASRRVPLRRGSFEYYLEIFNVLNSENQCCTSSHSLSIGSGVSVSPQFDDYLPLFPSFGFVWRFGEGSYD